MALYRFRVTFEEFDDVHRDIEIKSNQTFADLQRAILNSIGFDDKHASSFYMSNDHWVKGKEITSGENNRNAPLMSQSRLSNFILDPHQKIYFVYDLDAQWSFYVELIKILPKEEENVSYPALVKTVGTAPKQYGATALGAVPTDLDFPEDGVVSGIDEDEEVGEGREGEEEDGEDREEGEEGEDNDELGFNGHDEDFKEEY